MQELWKQAREFAEEEDAVGVVEIILILVVLISLVVLFKGTLTTTVKNLLQKITNQVDEF
jgi:Flp pilus assembly pilin Flp